MAKRLSVYVQHLTKYDALALLLASNEPVTARFATGDRASQQSIEHTQLVGIVQEAAPSESMADLRAGRPTRFTYDEAGPLVTVEVVPSPPDVAANAALRCWRFLSPL